jgi:hypothetical protein
MKFQWRTLYPMDLVSLNGTFVGRFVSRYPAHQFQRQDLDSTGRVRAHVYAGFMAFTVPARSTHVSHRKEANESCGRVLVPAIVAYN